MPTSIEMSFVFIIFAAEKILTTKKTTMEIVLLILLIAIIVMLALIAKSIGNQMRANKQQMALKAEQKAAEESERARKAQEQAQQEALKTQLPTDGNADKGEQGEEQVATRQLVIDTLSKMNCTPRVQENTGIAFNFQGGNFVIDAEDGCKFIIVYYPFWYTFRPDDIEMMAACQKAVSRANHKYNCTTLYSIYKDENAVALHTKRQMLFIKEIPALEQYLPSMLTDFFRSAHEVAAEMDKVKELEETGSH